MEDLNLNEDIKIEHVDELQSLLERAYWIEAEFENSFEWEAYSHVQEKHRDLIFKLSHDSQGHKTVLKRVIDDLDGISLEEVKEGSSDVDFEYKPNWEDSEVFSEMLKYELLAKDIYSRIKEHISEGLLDEIWEGEAKKFYKSFQYLIEEEEKHVELVDPRAGSVQRIR